MIEQRCRDDNWAGDFLGVDRPADERLLAEIEQAYLAGHDVTIGRTDDPSYRHPEKIAAVYNFLHGLDEELDTVRRQAIAQGVGRVGLNPIGHTVRRERAVDRAIDPRRVAMLYGPNRAVPWHEQRGRAGALLTIVSAHDLMVDSNPATGVYETMSGLLDKRVFDLRFDHRADWLAGYALEQALTEGEMRFNRCDLARASAKSDARLAQLQEFIESPVSPVFKEVAQYCTDALGIRARKAEVHGAIRDHLLSLPEKERAREFLMMSFGCGTALPMLEVIKDLKESCGISSRLVLLDQDPLALASAVQLADDMGLSDNIEIHCEQLFNRFGRPIRLYTVLGDRQLDVAEDSGLREYLPDWIYRWLTRESWRALRPGGIMTTGNMNQNRPQAEFLHGMMGWWPLVRMRTITDGLALHRQAGVPIDQTTVRVTRDGVYSMYFTKKPS